MRYWNRIKHCTKTERRKFASDNCRASSFGFVRNLAKKCCESSIWSSIVVPSFSLVAWTEPRCSSNLKLLNADKTLVMCCKIVLENEIKTMTKLKLFFWPKNYFFSCSKFEQNLRLRIFSNCLDRSIDLDYDKSLVMPRILYTNYNRFSLEYFPIERYPKPHHWHRHRIPLDFPN